MSRVQDYFYKGGLNCAEATMKCLIEDGAVDVPDSAVRMMTGFGGGMQRGAVCGAVVAAVSAIGSRTGRISPEEPRETSSKLVKQFLTGFENEFGTLYCRELQQTYVKEHALKSEGMYRACTVFVEKAVELAEKVLSEE